MIADVTEVAQAPAKRAWPSLTGCAIAPRSQMPQARVLATSFLEFHPGSTFAILILDGTGEEHAGRADVKLLYPGDLDLKTGEEWRLPMLYDEGGLSALLKPALLKILLRSGAATVAYFELATEIFSSLGDIIERVQKENPVIATDPPLKALQVDQAPNLPFTEGETGRSFIAVTRGAEEILGAWFEQAMDRSSRDNFSIPRDSGPVAEQVFDSIPPRVIMEPAFAIGYWNLDPKTFVSAGDHYEVEGRPLRSFDFRGYDPGKPHLLSKHQGLEPRILLSDYPAITKICDEYREKLVQAGYHKCKSLHYRFDYLWDGLRIDHRMRRLYRKAFSKYKQGLDPEPPSPFGPEREEGFLHWLNQPLGQTKKVVTRYMLSVHSERKDVKKAFPAPLAEDAAAFHDWYVRHGQQELELPAALLPSNVRHRSDSVVKKSRWWRFGTASVNVAGYFHAELGVGAAARNLVSAMEAAKIPFNTISCRATANRQTHPFPERPSRAGHADINIVCVNADQMRAFAETGGRELWQGGYIIGVWFWEVEDLPNSCQEAFHYVDEVWVASEFMRETLLKVSPKPVFKFQLPILKPEIDPTLSRGDLRLPDQFLFLFSFDFLSVLERKNPVGLIEAFSRAFRPNEGPALIIKTINGDKRILEMEKLKYAARARPDVILKDGYLSTIENNTLTALADSYVSLHRSEGFGLTMAEAMALGRPTIATGYSGNLEFMTEENSYLCSYRRCEVGPEREPYPATSHWSEPDLDAAAQLLRHVYTNPEEAGIRGSRAAADIRRLHSPKVAGAVIHERLAKIRRRRTT